MIWYCVDDGRPVGARYDSYTDAYSYYNDLIKYGYNATLSEIEYIKSRDYWCEKILHGWYEDK